MGLEIEMNEWCRQFKTSRLWLTAVTSDKTGSDHTLLAYCKGLKTYCDWIGKNPDQLIAERRLEIKNEDTEMNAENKLRILRDVRKRKRLSQVNGRVQVSCSGQKFLQLQQSASATEDTAVRV